MSELNLLLTSYPLSELIILIVLLIVLLFGAKKIPELMKGLGKGVRSFKDGVNGKDDADVESKQ